jgi:hypothetical protein
MRRFLRPILRRPLPDFFVPTSDFPLRIGTVLVELPTMRFPGKCRWMQRSD